MNKPRRVWAFICSIFRAGRLGGFYGVPDAVHDVRWIKVIKEVSRLFQRQPSVLMQQASVEQGTLPSMAGQNFRRHRVQNFVSRQKAL